MALIYTVLASDSFQRADENPVNPAVWSDYPPTSIPANQIVSDELEPGPTPGGSGDSISIYYAITWPANQWAQVQLDAVNSPDFPTAYSTVLLVLGRGASQTNGYGFEVDGPLGPNCNVSIFSLNNDVVTNYLGGDDDVQIPLFAGDSIRMELYNGMISAYTIHDGVSTQILAPTAAAPVTLGAAPLNNGPVALDLFMNTDPSDVQLSNFSGGSITEAATIVAPTGNATPRANVSPTFPLMPQCWPLTGVAGSDPLAAETLPQAQDPNNSQQAAIVAAALAQSGNTGKRLV